MNNTILGRHKYGDLKLLARNLLRNAAMPIIEIESLVRKAARKIVGGSYNRRTEHAEDIALQAMSDVLRDHPRLAEWKTYNGE